MICLVSPRAGSFEAHDKQAQPLQALSWCAKFLFYVLAVVNFVFDVELFLLLAIFPVLFGDEAIDLV
jgi:hypothetical protein